MKYEFWGTEGTITEVFREGSRRIVIDNEFMDAVEVDSFVEAMVIQHRRNQWNEYDPMEQDRADFDRAIAKLGPRA